ncbi:MAG: hypothetical protein NTW14_03230 [bacterium]|nr:hypothetical protein [bacterium]
MGKVFIDRREGERRIGERRKLSPEGLALQKRLLEAMQNRRNDQDRRAEERRQAE